MTHHVSNTTETELSFVMFWRVTITREGTHVMTPTTYHDNFFQTREAVDAYLERIPNEYKMWCDVTEVLAVKQVRPGQPVRYFPLEKPIVFKT